MARTLLSCCLVAALVISASARTLLGGTAQGNGKGPCKCPKTCPDTCAIEGLCGADGFTYCNDCLACKAGTTVASYSIGGPLDCKEGCTDDRIPVCGTDGVTYQNPCQAKYSRATVDYPGVCVVSTAKNGQICTQEFEPVCDRRTNTSYANACIAQSYGVKKYEAGACGVERACIFLYAPVCGADRTTYSNSCFLGLGGTTLAHEGACTPEDCGCTQTGDRVCDTEGTEYNNLCLLRCAGQTLGKCAKPGRAAS